MPLINTGNGPIDHHFWIDIPLNVQGVFMQVKSLVCGTQAPYGLPLSRYALDQMQCIQVYDKQEVWLKQTTIPLIATKAISVYPQKTQAIPLKLDLGSIKTHVEGKSFSWILTKELGFPLQPVVSDYIANTTTIHYVNNTQTIQKVSKGETLGFLDLRSKDGSLTHLQWLIPMTPTHDQYTLYLHTAFVNALAQQPLAEETIDQQHMNRLEIRQRPVKIKKDKTNNQDPYPWLDKEDPHRCHTDDELIESKIDLSDSVLTPQEKEKVVKVLKARRRFESKR